MSGNIKALIEAELSVLVGEQVRQLRRAALMLGVDFGDDAEYEFMAGSQKGEVITRPKFSLHIHSSWRLLKEDAICLGQSAFFNRMSGFKHHDDSEEATESSEFTAVSREINEMLKADMVRVTKIEATELGDLKVYMGDDYCLELFVDDIEGTESWRFFRNDDDSEHFVVFNEDS